MQKVFRTGNSLAVTIPSRFVLSVGVKSGDSVKVQAMASRGRIIYRFSSNRQLAFDEQFFQKLKKKQ